MGREVTQKILDHRELGFEVIGFASVGLHSQSEPDLRSFLEASASK